MAKTIFEEMGGTYVRQGDYFLPDLKLPEKENKHRRMGTTAQTLSERA